MDLAALRLSMIDNQLRTNEVFDLDILDAMGELPREQFVAASHRSMAYSDHALPMAGNPDRLMMPPVAACRLVQLCEPRAADVALVVGCGSGFTAALIARLVSSVVAIDVDEALVASATDTVSELGIENAAVVEADLEAGLPSEGPFDVIICDGGVDYVPSALLEQLREGGRLVAVEGSGLSAPVMIYRRSGDEYGGSSAFNLHVPHLPGFAKEAEFVF